MHTSGKLVKEFSCAVLENRFIQQQEQQQQHQQQLQQQQQGIEPLRLISPHNQQLSYCNEQHRQQYIERLAGNNHQQLQQQNPPTAGVQHAILPEAPATSGLQQPHGNLLSPQPLQELGAQIPRGQRRPLRRHTISMDGHVIDMSSSATPLTSPSAFSDDSGCGSDLIELTRVTPSNLQSSDEVPAFEWAVMKMLEKEQARKVHMEKIEACRHFELPLDPWKWTSTDVTKWASWFMRKAADPASAQDVITRFENYPITGETLSNYSEKMLEPYFGENSHAAHECLQDWLEGMSPRGYDLQRQILILENTKQTYLDRLVDCVQDPLVENMDVGHPLTPPHSDYDAPLQADDALRGINNNVIVHHVKPEFPSFPFTDPCLNECQFLFPQPSLMKQCPDQAMATAQPELIGATGGMFDSDHIAPMMDQELKLDIESDHDEPSNLCIKEELPVLQMPHPLKRSRGRPRKPKPPKQKRDPPILYKFILKHLNDPTGDSNKYVTWVNKAEGLFRFYSGLKDDFAELWGRFKGKREHMTYQNMARALRNYTRGNRKIMTSVRKKLHYKFTPEFIQ